MWRKNGARGVREWFRVQASQQDILFEPPNTISSYKKGGDLRNNLPQKRHRDIDCHPGTRPRLRRKAPLPPSLWTAVKKHLEEVIKAQG